MQLVCQVFVSLRFSRLLVVRALSSATQERDAPVSFGAFPVCQVVLWAVAVGGAAQVISGAVRLGSTDGLAARLGSSARLRRLGSSAAALGSSARLGDSARRPAARLSGVCRATTGRAETGRVSEPGAAPPPPLPHSPPLFWLPLVAWCRRGEPR